MESILTTQPLFPRQLLPIFRPSCHSLRPPRRRRLRIMHACTATPAGSLHLPSTPSSSSSSSLCSLQPPKPPTSIGISVFEGARKTLALVIFAAAISLLPFPAARLLPAMAVSAVAEKTEQAETPTDHEFSGYTRRLLSVVSVLLRRVEDVKSGKGEMTGVKKALKEVKRCRMNIQNEVLGNFNAELKELKRVKKDLTKRSEKVFNLAFKAMKERDMLFGSDEENQETKGRIEELDRKMGYAESECNDLWMRIGEIEDMIMRKETMTYSIAIRELYFVEKESELLVQRFGRRMAEAAHERHSFDCLLPHFLN